MYNVETDVVREMEYVRDIDGVQVAAPATQGSIETGIAVEVGGESHPQVAESQPMETSKDNGRVAAQAAKQRRELNHDSYANEEIESACLNSGGKRHADE